MGIGGALVIGTYGSGVVALISTKLVCQVPSCVINVYFRPHKALSCTLVAHESRCLKLHLADAAAGRPTVVFIYSFRIMVTLYITKSGKQILRETVGRANKEE